MIFLTLACKNNCKELDSFEGLILVYDEYSCPKCLTQAIDYLKNLKETNEFKLIVIAPNSFSKKKLNIIFRDYNPEKILEGLSANLDCMMENKNTSLYIKKNNKIEKVKDFN